MLRVLLLQAFFYDVLLNLIPFVFFSKGRNTSNLACAMCHFREVFKDNFSAAQSSTVGPVDRRA